MYNRQQDHLNITRKLEFFFIRQDIKISDKLSISTH